MERHIPPAKLHPHPRYPAQIQTLIIPLANLNRPLPQRTDRSDRVVAHVAAHIVVLNGLAPKHKGWKAIVDGVDLGRIVAKLQVDRLVVESVVVSVGIPKGLVA